MNTLQDYTESDKIVFYRTDYNVPLKDGQIQDDFRIVSSFETIEYLSKKKSKIIIGTHIGKPKGKKVAALETRIIAQYLADAFPNKTIRLAHDIGGPEVTAALEEMVAGDILVLPNLRFYPGEEENDPAFAEVLATLADVYVNDAFACNHRAHASIVGVPALLPSYAGYLVEEEVGSLGSLLENPKRPFVVVMGGAKVSDKIEVIRSMGRVADSILIGGAMANTFLLAKGVHIGSSLAESDKVELAAQLIEELGEKLVLAADYVKDDPDNEKTFRYLDIGEQAIAEFKERLHEAKTIFWNGSLGLIEEPPFDRASREITEYIAGLKGVTSIIAGGDTVEMVSRLNIGNKFSFISTGGGAALEFLAGEDLPGIKALQGDETKI